VESVKAAAWCPSQCWTCTALRPSANSRLAHALDRDVQALEGLGRQLLLLAQQPQQDVLGADVVVPEDSRLLVSEDDDLSGPFCEPLEHRPEHPTCACESIGLASLWFET
jgi:hypothetical protein